MSRDTEYNTLRAEILQNANRQFSMVGFAFTVTAALIGYGLTSKNAFIFLVPLPVLALVLIHLIRNIYSIMRISSYIRTFIEREEKDLKWETYICRFRTEERSQKQPSQIRHTLPSFELVLFVAGWLCIILSLLYAQGYQYLAAIAVAILWLSFWVIIRRWIRYETSGQLECDLDAVWAEVARKAEPNEPQAQNAA